MLQTAGPSSSASLSPTTLRNCFFRSYFLLAGMNTKGMQHIGFSSAIDPALNELYPSPEKLREARLRYAPHFNCHPFLTPYILGVFIHCEQAIINGSLPPATFNTIRDTYTYTLSVIGDNLLSGGVYISCTLVLCMLLLTGNIPLALTFLGLTFLLFHSLRLALFVFGLRHGLHSMQWLQRFQPITLAERCKFLNALLLALLFGQSILFIQNLATPLQSSLTALPAMFPFVSLILASLGLFLIIQTQVALSRIVGGLSFFILTSIFTYLFFVI